MVHSYGLRSGTRDKFARPFRKHGAPGLTQYMTNYKLGDVVDIVVNGSVHKGMPHKYYHGLTGHVWNFTPRAIGVVVNKKVGGRIIAKKLHVRVEHVRKSISYELSRQRIRENDAIKVEAKKQNKVIRQLKRVPAQPQEGRIVKVKAAVRDCIPLPYDVLTRFKEV